MSDIGQTGATAELPQYSSGHQPSAPGPKRPEQYPTTPGANYNIWGEQPGYIYNPYTDRYDPDPKAIKEYEDRFGLSAPEVKPPGMLEQYGPLVMGAGAMTLGSQLIKDPGALVPSWLSGGPAPAGAAAQTAGTTAAPGAAAASVPAAPTGLTGTMGTEAAAAGGNALWGGGAAEAGSGWLGATGAPTGALGAGAGIVAGGLTGYEQIKGLSNALQGKDMNTLEEAALALPTFGASFAIDPIKNAFGWGDQDKWKTEQKRLKGLEDEGTYIPPDLMASMPTGGRGKDELVNKDYAADFVGRDSNGNWLNNKFANDRDVKNLVGEDIVNYSVFAENDKDWFRKPMDERLAIANQALQSGAVSEHHGTIDVDFEKIPATGGTAPAAGSPAPFQTNAQGQVIKPPPAAGGVPPKGTRLSPGIYADGKGGSYRA